jgi:transcriptional regulator with XRE-family HTH domain
MIEKSVASVAMSRCSLSDATIARRIGVSQGAVNSWRNGNKRPTLERQKKIEEYLHIPCSAWLEKADPERVTVAYPRELVSDNNSRQKLDDSFESHEARVHAILGECFAQIEIEDMPTAERVETLNRAASALLTLQKLERNKWQSWSRTPEAKQLVQALRKGLEGYPDAARSIAEELGKLLPG